MTLIDTIVGSALMLVVFVGIAALFQLSVSVVINNKARAGAIALTNERMEYLRSLSYGQVGVIGGIPAGIVPQEEEVESSGTTYTRRTMVLYGDDAADGLGAADENDIIADYKTIRVEVIWNAKDGERSVVLVGRVSPAGIESAVPGGTLVLEVRDFSGNPVSNAEINIANTGTVPAISIRTYTNIDGSVTFIGAPAASEYQITVGKEGYSSAQTYAVSAQNPNPDPRHLTVADDQTTSAAFEIDLLASKTIETFHRIEEEEWEDTFANSSQLTSMSTTTVAGGALALEGAAPFPPQGTARSFAIEPEYLSSWRVFRATSSAPAQTAVLFRFYDEAGTLLPDSTLGGNAAGFSSTPVDLSSISTSSYPALRIGTTLISSDSAATPSVDAYSIEYASGPEPLPDLSFTMRGARTIGNNPAVYKYEETHSSGASAQIELENIEADTYTLSIPGTTYSLAESCNPSPETLAPGSTQSTRMYFAPYSTHSLLIDVRSNAGALLEGALVQATTTLSDVTRSTSDCGQAFFSGLSDATYGVAVSLSGYQTFYASIPVQGATRYSAVLNQ